MMRMMFTAVALALAGCNMAPTVVPKVIKGECTDPASLAVVANLKAHPEEWTWEGAGTMILENEKRDIWLHEYQLTSSVDSFLDGAACKTAVWEASVDVRAARLQEAKDGIVHRLTQP